MRGNYPPCRSSWCAKCYRPRGSTPFPIKPNLDDEGNPIKRDDDDFRFLSARDGDHYLVPFQCDLCQFRNIQGRNPIPLNFVDDLLLEFIRRASLDAFWARETGTVNANLGSLRRASGTKNKFGMRNLFPPMGPFPLNDSMGMGQAVAVLDKSLDPGRHSTFVQWATMRKTRSAFTNIAQAAVGGLDASVGAYEKNRLWISSASTQTFFFHRFATGLHRRVGEIVKPDEPITVELLHEILRTLETEYQREIKSTAPGTQARLLSISRTANWFTIGFCASLRGEEMPLIELAGTKESLQYLDHPPQGVVPHFRVVFAGPTKNNRISGSKFFLPIAAVTEGTGIQAGKWFRRFIGHIDVTRRRTGALFQKLREIPKMFEFEEDFFSAIELTVATRPHLLPPSIDIREDFGLFRSLRRGSTAHAINRQVPRLIIDTINRWRKERNSDNPSLPMRDHYAKLEALLETLLLYSTAF